APSCSCHRDIETARRLCPCQGRKSTGWIVVTNQPPICVVCERMSLAFGIDERLHQSLRIVGEPHRVLLRICNADEKAIRFEAERRPLAARRDDRQRRTVSTALDCRRV